ncbi:ribonuclease H-like domain-containing protein [Tanacetum coccineum]
MLSRSSAEAEYRGVAHVVVETCWLRNLLHELHTPLSSATFVYCDNVSAVYLSSNLVQHQRTKYIEIDIHFVRDLVAPGQVRVLHVPSRYQYADIFTKGLPSALFEEFRTSLSVMWPPALTSGECKWMNPVDEYFLINVYGPQQQPEKANLYAFIGSFIQEHTGKAVLFGDLNEVRDETERFGS